MSLLEWRRPYSIKRASIWPYVESTETWGTKIDLSNVGSASWSPEMQTDKLPVYGKMARGLAVAVGHELSISFGGLQDDARAAMTGRASALSGDEPNEVRGHSSEDGKNMPYFAICVDLRLDDGSGDGIYRVANPFAMLQSLFALEMDDTHKFIKSQVPAYCFNLIQEDGTEYDSLYERDFETGVAIPAAFTDVIAALV
jgi:hypothetical protein